MHFFLLCAGSDVHMRVGTMVAQATIPWFRAEWAFVAKQSPATCLYGLLGGLCGKGVTRPSVLVVFIDAPYAQKGLFVLLLVNKHTF